MWGNNDYVKAFGQAAHNALSRGALPKPQGSVGVSSTGRAAAGAMGRQAMPKAMPQATSVGNYYNQINQLSNRIK